MQNRSTFYSFKHFFNEEQKKKGICYANPTELENAALPVWMNTPPAMRINIKNLCSGLATKAELLEQGKLKGAERSAIKHLVRSRAPNKGIVDEIFNVIDVNYYCSTSNGRYLVGECCMLRFSLQEGVTDYYHIHVNPGKIPIGYHSDVRRGCRERGLIPPNEYSNTDGWSILNDIKNFVRFSRSCILFTMPDKVAAVKDFIREISCNSGEDPSQFMIYKLDYLFYTLYNEIKTGGQVFTKEEALRLLQVEKYKRYPGLRCEHHYKIDNFECSIAFAKTWAFTIMDTCCPLVGILPLPGVHLPLDFQNNLAFLGIFRAGRKCWEEKFGEPSTSYSSAKSTYTMTTSAITGTDCTDISEQLFNVTLNRTPINQPMDEV